MILPCFAVQGILPEKTYQSAKILALTVGIGGVAVAITLMVGYVAASPTFGWTGGRPQTHALTCTGSTAFTKPASKAELGQHFSTACIVSRVGRSLLRICGRQAVCAFGMHGPILSFLPADPQSCKVQHKSWLSVFMHHHSLTSSDSHQNICFFLPAPSPSDHAGRSLSLLDPTYASKYIPIIASVSEHQPPTWSSYFTDINVMVSASARCCCLACAFSCMHYIDVRQVIGLPSATTFDLCKASHTAQPV